jgi:cephalosporin hydroxylase
MSRPQELWSQLQDMVRPRVDSYVNREFLRRYYDDPGTWRNTRWLGVPTEKCPLDLWIFQEIIHETRPDLIIEAGTRFGGSALFLASVLDALGSGQVVTVDVADQPGRPTHPRITYLLGSSTAPEMVEEVARRAKEAERVMVVLDSDHSEAHVLNELRSLAPLVTPGCYLIVEDTIVNGNPVLPEFGPGPGEALQRYLRESPGQFELDTSREKFRVTFNPGGYLRRS